MGKNIMIVDDNAFMRMMLKDMITDAGYNVVGEADNARIAVRMYLELNPDVITMDITMPDISGIEAAKKIMAIDERANIIIISAMNQADVVEKALQAGVKDFIAKPFQKERVIKAIDGLRSR